jgi:hypothetical protein
MKLFGRGSGELVGIEQPAQAATGERTHVLRTAIIGAIALVGIGFLVVNSRTPTAPHGSSTNWVGLGTLIDSATADPQAPTPTRPDEQSLFSEVTKGAPFVYIPPAGGPAQSVASNTDEFSIEDVLAALSPQSKTAWTPATTPEGEPSLMEAYAFVPQGLFSTTTEGQARTDAQQRLFDYGNELGSLVQAYETMHQNTPQIATDHLADRANPEKVAALKQVGDDIILLGKRIKAMEEVPTSAAQAHASLAAGYQEVGAALKIVADARSDEQLLDAVKAYNATMDELTPRYIAMVTLFSMRNVSFTASDPGSVFSFSP